MLWDTGYVLGPVSQPLKVYTASGKSMADIAISTAEFTITGCTYEVCADSYGQMALRSKFCSGTQMLSAVKCMTEDFAGEDHNLSMWANNGHETDVPEPTLIRHEWINSDTAITCSRP